MNRGTIYIFVPTGLLAGPFTCQVSKLANAQTGLADIVDVVMSKLE